MSLPIQLNKLQSAVQSCLPDVRQFMQRNAAQCNRMRRAEGQNGGTKPPSETPSLRSILSPRQLMAISLLLAGRQVKVIANQLGIHRATIFRWKRDPQFQAEIRRRAELAGPVQRTNPRSAGASSPQRSLAQLRESNRWLYEKLTRESSSRR